MPERKGFDLGDYVEVKDRIAIFYDLFGQGRLVTTDVRLTTEPDGKPRVIVEAAAYRTPDDPLPGRGWSWMELPGTTSYTKGSELENTETSAWGRAIASLGILIDRSIASQNEVKNKAGESDRTDGERAEGETHEDGEETLEFLGNLKPTGRIEKGGAALYQGEWRESPEGHALGFRLKLDGKSKAIPQVAIIGAVGEALWVATSGDGAGLVGQKVTVGGRLYAVRQQGRTTFHRLVVGESDDPERSFIETPDFRIPAIHAEDAPAEASSAPMFDDSEQAAIDAALESVA